MNTFFGIDIGGTRIKTALIAETGEVIVKRSYNTLVERGFADLAGRIRVNIEESLKAANVSMDSVRGVGAGVPGFLDIDKGMVLEAVNLGWRDLPFVSLLQDTLKLPVALENDANVAALGEAWTGAGQGSPSVLCVTVGTGVGGGLVFGGRLYRGANGMAGEIGHITVERHGYLCNCGREGCLETAASATAIIRHAKALQKAGQLPANVEIAGAQDVFVLRDAGNAAASQVIEEAADWLGYGLAQCAITVNPQTIVIGGGVSKAGEKWLELVRRAFARYSLQLVVEGTDLVLAALGNDAGVIGAARLISQKLELA